MHQDVSYDIPQNRTRQGPQLARAANANLAPSPPPRRTTTKAHAEAPTSAGAPRRDAHQKASCPADRSARECARCSGVIIPRSPRYGPRLRRLRACCGNCLVLGDGPERNGCQPATGSALMNTPAIRIARAPAAVLRLLRQAPGDDVALTGVPCSDPLSARPSLGARSGPLTLDPCS